MVEKQFKQGDIIVREGDFGNSFFQITNGSAAVLVGEGTPDEMKLTELHDGDFFGELAVIQGYHRSATVKALEDGMKAVEIPGPELTTYFTEQPDKIMALMRHLSSRIRQLTKDYTEVTAALDEITSGKAAEADEGLMARIRRFIAGSGSGKTDEVSEQVLWDINFGHERGYAKRVNSFPAGTVIFREGDEANCMFDIHWGTVNIYTGYGTPEQKLIAELSVNRFFGEMGMIDQEPRSATAVVGEYEATLETIYPEDLEDIFKRNPPKIGMILQHLALRLMRLTNDYAEACRKLSEVSAN